MANYAVRTSAMDDGATSLQGITDKLAASLEQLEQRASMFKNANAGLAIDGYDEAQRQWSLGMTEMQNALRGHAGNLVRINDNYLETDHRGAALFQR
ncbi:WXG100 family type VII secretion target [Plantactinospora sp. B5E13]|uniref:WXG100 family type VII secretion target n=1 Tax=unclassified Plantactinospora TaxID=2631981 RepID=UPI00325F8964